MSTDGLLRIGELSRRVGVSPELLRAWESRYGLVQPERTPGGLRLYSGEDERRVRTMLERIADGLSAAEAARVTLTAPGALSAQQVRSELDEALTALNEPAAQTALDRVFGSLGLEDALTEVILPYLRDLGDRWATTERSIAQEHFASNVIGGRLRALARGWGAGDGRRVLLACPPGEHHELGLLCFGLLLRNRGWRVAYLGAETPAAELATTTEELSPDLVVLCAIAAQRFLDVADGIRQVSARARVALGGAGVTEELARSLGAESFPDLVAAAHAVGDGDT